MDETTNPNLDLFALPFTPEEKTKHIQAVSSHHGKNAKLAWNRKIKKMDGLIADVRVLQEQILELTRKQQPTLDDIAVLRAEMIKECVHPKDHLVHLDTYLVCKFCDRKISIPRIVKDAVAEDAADESEDVE